MKTIFTLLTLCLFSICLNAQDTTATIKNISDSAFQYLNKNQVPYGVLYDRVAPLAFLFGFRADAPGVPSLNSSHFHQAYYEFYESAYETAGLAVPDSVISLLESRYTDTFSHPLTLLRGNFSSFDSAAVANGALLVQNGKLYDVQGQNPYVTHKINIPAILNGGEDWRPGTHQIVFDKDFILGNGDDPIDTISIDFHDGNGVQKRVLTGLSLEQYNQLDPFSVTVSDTDVAYRFDITIVLEGNMIYRVAFLQKVAPEAGCDGCIVIEGCDGADQIEIEAEKASVISDYNGAIPAGMDDFNSQDFKVSGTAYIFYSDANCTSRQITKPIIFIDGYDPTNKRGVRQIYTKYINQQVIINGSQVKLADYVRSQGYDLIIYDYYNANDYIEDNAMGVEKLLQTLWNQHGSTMQKDFVLIGPSLGALIARYALADMEDKNIDHHTRLYFSFDGPNQGANAGIGIQQMIYYLLQSYNLNKQTQGKLDKMKFNIIENMPARQMLVDHKLAGSCSPAPDWFRPVLLSHFNAIGNYPQNCRNVAIVNGNKNGLLNPNISPGGRYVRIEDQRWTIVPSSHTSIDWSAFASASNTSSYSGRFWTYWPTANTVLGLPWFWTNTYSCPGPNNRSYDACPGSFFTGINDQTELDLEKQFKDFVHIFTSNLTISSGSLDIANIGKLTFVPTTSSVDYQAQNVDIYSDLSNVVLAKCAGTSPFDRVYANTYSTHHVKIDDNIADWFWNEIKETPPAWETVSIPVTGNNSVLCTGSSVNLSVSGLPTGTTYTWSVPSTLSFTGQSSNAITLSQGNSNINGQVASIAMSASFNCGNFSGSALIPLGTFPAPTPTYSISPGSDCSHFNVTFTFPSPPTGISYDWYVSKVESGCSSACTYHGSNGGSKTYVLVNGQEINYSVTASNICGSDYQDAKFELVVGGTCSNPTYSLNYLGNMYRQFVGKTNDNLRVFPNPTSFQWHFVFGQNDGIAKHATICDLSGKIVYDMEIASGHNLDVDCQLFAPGFYIGKIEYADGTSKCIKLSKE